jgi:hypothetical protein
MAYRCAALFFLFLYPALFMHMRAQGIPHFVEDLTAHEGLGSNNINDIAQDDNNFLWMLPATASTGLTALKWGNISTRKRRIHFLTTMSVV